MIKINRLKNIQYFFGIAQTVALDLLI